MISSASRSSHNWRTAAGIRASPGSRRLRLAPARASPRRPGRRARPRARRCRRRRPGGTRRQRLERLLLLRLAGGRERRERAPVERAVRGDDVEPVTATVALAVPPRQLDRALVGLGAGVAEEHAPPPPSRASRRAATCGLQLVVVEVRDVQQRRAPGRRSRPRPPDARGRATSPRAPTGSRDSACRRNRRAACPRRARTRPAAGRTSASRARRRAPRSSSKRRGHWLTSTPSCRHPPG